MRLIKSVGGSTIEQLEQRQMMSAVLRDAAAASMAYDNGGTLHVAWYDSQASDLKYATQGSDGGWSPVVSIDASPAASSQMSLALNSSGLPGVAYYDAGHGDLHYASLAGGAWTIATVDSKGNVGQNPSLAYDATDHPLISYYAATTQDLRLATFTRNRWKVMPLAAAGNVGRFSSVAINPVDGSWGVAYEAATRHQIRYSHGRGSAFATAIVDTLKGDANWTSKPSLAFDSSGHPFISYGDSSSSTLVLSQTLGRKWSRAVAVNSNPTDSNLSIDPTNGEPRIVYTDGLGSIRLASHSSGGWSTSVLGTGDHPTAAINSTTNSLTIIDNGSTLQLAPSLAAPIGLTATAISRQQVDLSWAADSGAETGFLIERSTDSGAYLTMGIIASSVHTYSDSTVAAGTTCAYRVFATIGMAQSITGADANVAVPANTMLAATGLTVQTSLDWAPGIDATWADNSTAEAGYRIERATDGTHFSMIDILPPDSTSYTDNVVTDPVAYSYRVIPFDALGDGATSAVQSLDPAPLPPTDLKGLAISAGEVDLTWTNHSTSFDHLEIYCIINYDSVAVKLDLPATATSFNVTSLADGTPLSADTEYEFWVNAIGGQWAQGTGLATVTTGFAPPAPLDVDGITSNSISLSWGDVLGETGYELQWAPDNSHFTRLATTGPDVTTYVVSNLPENDSHWFRIRALGQNGNSNFLWYAMSQTAPISPANVVATALPGGQIQVTWDDHSQIETGYVITVFEGNTPTSSQISVGPGETSALITESASAPLQPGRPYRISVATEAGSAQSDKVFAATVIAAG